MKNYWITNLLILILFTLSGCQTSPDIIMPSLIKTSTATLTVTTPVLSITNTPIVATVAPSSIITLEPSKTPEPTKTPTEIHIEFKYSDQDNTYYYTATGGKVECDSSVMVNGSWLITSKINGIDVVIGAYNPSTHELRVFGYLPATLSFDPQPSDVAITVEDLLNKYLAGRDAKWEKDILTKRKLIITFGEGNAYSDNDQSFPLFADIRAIISTPEYMTTLEQYAKTGVWTSNLPLLPRNINIDYRQ